MFFVIQKEKIHIDDVDTLTIVNELEKTRLLNEYIFMNLKEISNGQFASSDKAIPIGTIQFVEGYLKNIKGIEKMNPIEVPSILRKEEFLCRDYKILDKDELMNIHGRYFCKYASHLKSFSHLGDIDQLKYVDEGKEPFLKDGLYVVSEIKDILAEYRVYVVDDEIKGIQFYDGYPTIMPTPTEIAKLQKMINIYMLDNDRPKAYTMDIAIIKSNNVEKRDLMIVEVHPFACVGLYGMYGGFLPYAYKQGLDYYLNINKPIEKFNNK